MTRIVVATGNQGKLKEIKDIFGNDLYEVVSMKECGISSDPDETGATFEENALIKARAVAELVPDSVVLADDSGLEVDALNKEPGIYSARYMGEDTSYDIKNANILERMEGVLEEKRTARFVCAMAAILPASGKANPKEVVVRGVMEGRIGYEIKGENGFGYDPIFFLPEYNMTSAELSAQEKNAISHRGAAIRLMRHELSRRRI